MTKETMNIHKALAELKVLDDRITKAISNASFCVANKHSNTKIGGVELDKYKELMEASYNKAADLIRRREAIKKAVVNSNAVTKVNVAGTEYTVAEAIEMKNHGLDFKQIMLQAMKRQYESSMSIINTKNLELEKKAEDYVISLYGSKESKTSNDEFEKTRKSYIEAHTMDLVDPIDVHNKMEKLEEEISKFTAEVDSCLSVSNALTVIEVEY